MQSLVICLVVLLIPVAALAQSPQAIIVNFFDDEGPTQARDYSVDTATHPEDVSYIVTTPTLDALANQGIRLNRFFSQNVCSPGRAELMMGREVGHIENPLGRVQSGQTPAQWTMEAQVGMSIVTELQNAGYIVAGFGKWHLNTEQVFNYGLPSAPNLWGFDHYEAMVQSNDGAFGACSALRTNALGSNCANHNYWCKYSLNDPPEIMGNGSSATGPNNEYVDAVIRDAARDYLRDVVVPNAPQKYAIFIFWHGPHSPWYDGDSVSSGAPFCDFDDDGVAEAFADSRPPGSTAMWDESDGSVPVFIDQLQFVDSSMATVHAEADEEAGGLNHLIVVSSDNGVANGGAGPLCVASRGRKVTPWPCGTSVVGIFTGDDVYTANAEIDGYFRMFDLSKTIVDLAGGTLPTRGGMSFANCITNSDGKTVGNCPARDIIITEEYGAFLGGSDGTDGTPAGENRYSPRDGDTAAEWSYHEFGSQTNVVSGREFFLWRGYDTTVVHGPYCEILMEITPSDRYLAVATTPIAETSCTAGSHGGAIDTGSLDADELVAYEYMAREVTKRNAMTQAAPTIGSRL